MNGLTVLNNMIFIKIDFKIQSHFKTYLITLCVLKSLRRFYFLQCCYSKRNGNVITGSLKKKFWCTNMGWVKSKKGNGVQHTEKVNSYTKI